LLTYIPSYTRQAERIFASSKVGPFILVVPSTPTHWTVAEVLADPITKNSINGTFTHFGNVLDLTGVSVPAGTYPVSELTGGKKEEETVEKKLEETTLEQKGEKESLLPFGVTLIGGSRTDAEVLEVARRFDEAVKAKGR
jgi:Asp-tRNA(Asn)/Glu-tRNA(Gln) amidotransferase A subunit family amidase